MKISYTKSENEERLHYDKCKKFESNSNCVGGRHRGGRITFLLMDFLQLIPR